MANKNNRALISRDHFLQQVERFQIQIIGRLIHHQHIGRLAQPTRQQQARQLAPRQHIGGRTHLRRMKQEVFHIADDMHGFFANGHQITGPVGQRILDGQVLLNARTRLIQHQHREIFAETHIARIGFQMPQQHVQQCGFTRPICAHKPQPVAALNLGGKPVNNALIVKLFDQLVGFDDQLAGFFAGHQCCFHLPFGAAMVAPVLA